MSEIITAKGEPKKVRFVRTKRILKIFSISFVSIITAILLILCGIYYHWSRNSLPKYEGQIKVSSLQSEVSIVRGERGIPYLTAQNRKDLYFAQGYATAQDRLWQMDLLRRTATGRLSELLGSRSLDFDKRQRNYGFRQISERTVEKISPELREILQSYADGVNVYIEQNKGNLPLEFRLLQYEPELWKPADSIATGKLMAQTLAGSWEKDLMRGFYLKGLDEKSLKYLLPEYSPLDQIIVGDDNSADKNSQDISVVKNKIAARNDYRKLPDLVVKGREIERQGLALVGLDAELPGSNNWVVSGHKTTTGKPFLANDPHLGFGIPSVWHQIQMKTADGSVNLAGVTFPGTPGVVIGHNHQIAWGVTNAAPDVQDIYVEEFNPNAPNQYRVGSEWREAEVRKETIKVRQSNFSAATNDIAHEVILTRHGPIVSEYEGKKLALRWTGFDDVSEFSAFHQINYAKNWDEFQQALKSYPGPSQNFVYADTQGNIGYYLAAFIPKRKTGDGSLPIDGTLTDDNWEGFIPFEELPHLYNPPQGWIATANNRVVGKNYKYFLSREWSAPYRVKRINDLIKEKDKLSHEDMRRIQSDVYSIFDYNFAQAIKNILANNLRSSEPKFREIIEIIERFDGNLAAESIESSVVVTMREKLSERIAKGELGDNFKQYRWFNQPTGLEMILREKPVELLPAEFSNYEDLILAAYQDAAEELTKKFGADKKQWNWGKLNQVNFRHPLGIGLMEYFFNLSAVRLGGNAYTVNCNYKNWGVSMRMIVDLNDFDQTTQGVTVGQSGLNADSNYDNQLEEWTRANEERFGEVSSSAEKGVKNVLELIP